MAQPLPALATEIVGCRRCPRLVEWREEAAATRRAATGGEALLGRPVPGFGDPRARSSSSASRPRPTAATAPGGCSPAIARATGSSPRSTAPGVANQPTSDSRDDGLRSRRLRHGGRPLRAAGQQADPDERDNCLPYLAASSRCSQRARDRLRSARSPGTARCGRSRRRRRGPAAEAALRPRGRGARSGRSRCSAATTRASRTRSPASSPSRCSTRCSQELGRWWTRARSWKPPKRVASRRILGSRCSR